jgi:hypothetical protein
MTSIFRKWKTNLIVKKMKDELNSKKMEDKHNNELIMLAIVDSVFN